MGTVVRISAYFPADTNPPTVVRKTFDRVAEAAGRFSSFSESSELRRLEEAAWRMPTPVSAELAHLLGHGLRLAQQTGGAFDPTLGGVTRLLRANGWRRNGPSEKRLRAAWRRTGWKHVELDISNLTVAITQRGIQFDLGGIAKGYAADQALDTLRRNGVRQAVVAIGGDVAVGDPPPGRHAWKIGLDSLGPHGSVERELSVSNRGVSTSGSRERYYLTNGEKCSHIVVNSTDLCEDTTTAVSVIAPTALEADGLATALISLGRGGSRDFLSRRSEIEVYWADDRKAESQNTRPPR